MCGGYKFLRDYLKKHPPQSHFTKEELSDLLAERYGLEKDDRGNYMIDLEDFGPYLHYKADEFWNELKKRGYQGYRSSVFDALIDWSYRKVSQSFRKHVGLWTPINCNIYSENWDSFYLLLTKEEVLWNYTYDEKSAIWLILKYSKHLYNFEEFISLREVYSYALTSDFLPSLKEWARSEPVKVVELVKLKDIIPMLL